MKVTVTAEVPTAATAHALRRMAAAHGFKTRRLEKGVHGFEIECENGAMAADLERMIRRIHGVGLSAVYEPPD